MSEKKRIQIQLELPFGRTLDTDERVVKQMELGWRVASLQRLSDQEVLVTFEARRP